LDRHLAGARATRGPRAADAAWAEGLSLLPPQGTAEALALLDTPEQGQAEPAPVQASPLTPREREVAALVARGLSNRAIAQTHAKARGAETRPRAPRPKRSDAARRQQHRDHDSFA
jgi:hypothetical protein